MASAFDKLEKREAEYVRKRLLAGDSMASIREGTEISARAMKAMRNEVFAPLLSDASEVKKLANGPCLNPLEMTRYKSTARRKSVKVEQIEKFPA